MESALPAAAVLQHPVCSCFSNYFLATCLESEIPSTLAAALAPESEEVRMWAFGVNFFLTWYIWKSTHTIIKARFSLTNRDRMVWIAHSAVK